MEHIVFRKSTWRLQVGANKANIFWSAMKCTQTCQGKLNCFGGNCNLIHASTLWFLLNYTYWRYRSENQSLIKFWVYFWHSNRIVPSFSLILNTKYRKMSEHQCKILLPKVNLNVPISIAINKFPWHFMQVCLSFQNQLFHSIAPKPACFDICLLKIFGYNIEIRNFSLEWFRFRVLLRRLHTTICM